MVNRCFFFHFKNFHNLIINNRKKQIVLCPNINDNDKEWGKEFVETTVKKELEKLKMKWEELECQTQQTRITINVPRIGH